MKPVVHVVVPGPIAQCTGGYIYDRRIVEGLRAAGYEVRVHELAGRFPVADEVARAAAAACLGGLGRGALPVIDGLALPAFADVAPQLPEPWVALVHHPLALETGLDAGTARALGAIEGDLLRRAAGVVATSARTARDLAACGVDPARIAVIAPGTDPAPLARGSDGPGPVLLSVATLTPRKGHLVLLDALARAADLDWRLVAVGSTARDPDHAAAVRRAIARLRLDKRVALLGEQPEAALDRLYDGSDLFILASYHEGYGMALAEALARGLPVVATRAGAIPDTVPAAAGLLVPLGDAAALAGALRRVLTEPLLRAQLRSGARAARDRLPGWQDAAGRFAVQLERVTTRGSLRADLAAAP